MFLKILSLAVAALVFLVYCFIKIVPNMVAEKVNQNRDYDIKQMLQVDSYFRQNGSSTLQEAMMHWTRLLTDMDYLGEQTKDEIRELMQQTIIYGSTESVKYSSMFFQYMYEETHEDDRDGMVYIALIVSSLKHDFSGETVSPLDLLQIMIKDYKDHKSFYENTLKKIKDSYSI